MKASQITGQTLLGINSTTYPIYHGNCFDVLARGNHYRIVNFNVENFRHILTIGLTWPVEIKILTPAIAVIHDDRIPDDWFGMRWCSVCCPLKWLPRPQRLEFERRVSRGQIVVNERGYIENYNLAPRIIDRKLQAPRLIGK